MSQLVEFKINISLKKDYLGLFKGKPRGYGASATTTRVARKVLEEIRKGGKGVSYEDGPLGGAPISKPGKKSYRIGAKGGKATQFPRGYLSQSHEMGGRKGNIQTIMSRAPYTYFIIHGGVTPTGGVYGPNNYPNRVLKKVSADLSRSGWYRQELLRHFGIAEGVGYGPGTYLGDKDLV